MGRELFDLYDQKWEPLEGSFPSALLDTHPSGDFVAMQVVLHNEVTTERAAIWNTKARKIHWNPGNANALCWIENGTELLVLEKLHKEGAIRPPLFVTPTQAEYQHFLRRMSWPGLDTISCIELKFPMGWLIDIVPSPVDKLACFVWQDQCESGIEFVSWREAELCQLPKKGFCMDSNLIQGPVFNSDGSIIAMTFGGGFWWGSTPEEPSPGGNFNVGCLIWSETGSGIYNRIDLDVTIPAGWKPRDPEDVLHNEFLSRPEFISPHEVKIALPTGEEQLLSL
jgi:hypothetical protein